ncbi:equilibrative nucleoside transporter 2 isoform X1 [Entelurus aequoreus]|uniref:equilibrative nucleoside transporter 2 isoform X1 n=1 Tax=Entelurus aequoreus TaxID=161455 RepID=UPI002B1DABFF|nr:equilibrative nucleoside transporter 2 isoform X1 [Entelurus aequoreus]XP_061922124.1 equilibrative nucleoside transporter 2 isoform X1 [Entelurus aequoreus]
MNGRKHKEAPSDWGCLVALCFFVLGLGTLLPWNFFMTAILYFESRLNTTGTPTEAGNSTGEAPKEYYFNNLMTLLSQLPLLLFTLLNSILYQRISEAMRVGGSLVFILLLFILTTVLVKVEMDTERFFSVTMATIWFINSFGAVLQGSLFGLVGMFPQKYSSIFMSGQGLAGTFAAIAMLLSIARNVDMTSMALGYFVTPCVGTLFTFFCYLLLRRLEFAEYYLDKSGKYEGYTTDELLTVESSAVGNDKLNSHTNASVASSPNEDGALQEGKVDVTKQAFVSLEQVEKNQAKSSVIEVFKKIFQIWVMAFCVTFVFTVTLAVFPAITANVQTMYTGDWERYFICVCCFLTFNLNDWLGRTITTCVRWPRKESRLFPLLVVSRVVFIPLLLLCNIKISNVRHLPVLFYHDAAFTVIMALFSLSSGYFVCLSMSYAPQMVDGKDAETAGALMTFFLALGLSIGALLSFPLRILV